MPRWQGDTNFMPVLANTVVVPEALRELAAKLRAALPAYDRLAICSPSQRLTRIPYHAH